MKLKNVIAASLLLSTITASAFASTYHVCQNRSLGVEMMITGVSEFESLKRAEIVKIDIDSFKTFEAKVINTDLTTDIAKLIGDGFEVVLTNGYGDNPLYSKYFTAEIEGVIGGVSLPGKWRCKEVFSSQNR